MSRSKKARKVLSLLIAVVLVLGNLSSLAYADNNTFKQAKVDLKEEASLKIMPEVKEDLEKEDIVEVLIYMKDQANTTNVAEATRKAVEKDMTPYNTKLQVRRAVVEALQDKAETTQYSLLKYLEQEKGKGNVVEYNSHFIVNMVYVKATKDVVENISYMPEVGKIYKNRTHKLEPIIMDETKVTLNADNEVEWNIERVKADLVWDMGIDGTGVVVGSLDSGVDWTHPALRNKWRGYDPVTGETDPSKSWFDPVYGASLPADSDSHGTHVMGTIVGQEEDGSNKIGVAPGAQWITARVFNTAGSTTDEILISAADWMVAPGGDPDAAPDVVNNSWGGPGEIDDWYRDQVNNYVNAEIFPVFSAGNQRLGEPLPWPGSIGNPANYPESFAVAATDINDIRASFSKLGPSPYDETIVKPEISAPGVNIRSSIPGGGYTGTYSGTSMSAPHVSGTVALLRSANQALSVDDIRDILTRTARPLTDGEYPESPNFGYGYGMLDAFEAVSEVATGIGRVEGRVLKDGEDLEDATIIHEQEVTEVFVGSDIEIEASILDDVAVTEVELLVQPEGKSYWYLIPMTRISGDHKNGVYRGTITYDMLMGDSLKYRIRARDYAGEATITEDYVIEVSFGIVPDEYTQGFEETNAIGWTFDGSWDFGEATGVDPEPFEGVALAGTVIGGNYLASSDDWMITPPIDLRDASLPAASLRLKQWYNIETNYDNGHIYMTNDYGENWIPVITGITGSSNGWQEVVINLNDFIGSPDPVFVAFHFTSDGSVMREGWYIDDVVLMGPDSIAPETPTGFAAEATMTGVKLTWTHSPDGDLSHYNIYRSELSGEEYEKIAETSSNTFVDSDVVANTAYYYVVNAEDTSGNISEYTEEVSIVAPEVAILYSTDFEEDNGGFIAGGTEGAWEWGIPTSGPNEALSGEKLWATNLDGNYGTYVDAYIESPEIAVPEDKIPYLIFSHWYNTENRFDYGFVQISNDNGETWENISKNFTNASNGWINEEIPLTHYRGDTIKIRFNFHSDISVVREGWYIDDVTIAAIDFIPPETETIAYDDGTNENAIVLNVAGNGLAVRFTPTLPGKLMGADIYLDESFPNATANRLGFEIYQISEDGTVSPFGETLYVDNLARGDWNHIDLSDYDFFTAGEDFYISTMQDDIGDNTPGTGIDNDSPYGSRSYLNIAGVMEPMSTDIDGAIMIRAHMDYTESPPEVELSKISTKEAKAINAKVDRSITAKKSEDMVKMEEPDFRLNRNKATLSLDIYKTVSDEEVQNTPMVRGRGIPVDEATVTILETGRTVKTDPITGEYRMNLPAGTYTLRAEAYGYYPQDEVIVVEDNKTTSQSFMLEEKPRGTIVGRVFDRYYLNPASFAEIRVLEDRKVEPVIADENGNFIIPDVLVGTYTLKVTAEGFYAGEFTVTVEANQETNVELGLKRFVGIDDEIIYDDGTGENALVLNAAPNGLAVRFTPEKPGIVSGLNIYLWGNDWPTPGGNRLGFTIYDIVDGTPVQVGDPIFIDGLERGAWNYIDLSSFGFTADSDFLISTIQDAAGTNCPGTGIDEASPHGDRSYMNIGGEFQPISSEGIIGALMMRAIMFNEVVTPVITNLEEINYTNQDAITVEGTVSSDVKVNVYVNNEKVTSVDAEDLRFAVEVDLPLESNEIMVTAELEERETEPSPVVTVVKDQVLPTLTVDKPEDNAKVNVEVVHVSGSAEDNIGIRELLINGAVVELEEDGSFYERILVDQGENIITVKATDLAGNETVVERRVYVELDAPDIANIEPSEDVELRAGDVLNVSFNAPAGGQGYFRLLLPFENSPENIGNPMAETEEGLYEGAWTVPEGVAVTDLQVQVIYVDQYGYEISAIADGRVTIVGDMEYLAYNTVIVGNEAFDIEYLNNNASAQMKLIERTSTGKEVYVKLDENTIVNLNGQVVNAEVLPEFLTYYDEVGNILFYEK